MVLEESELSIRHLGQKNRALTLEDTLPSCEPGLQDKFQRCLDSPQTSANILKVATRGRVAQLGERIVRNDEVAGSIPVSSTIFSTTYADFRTRCSRPGWSTGSTKPVPTRSAQSKRKARSLRSFTYRSDTCAWACPLTLAASELDLSANGACSVIAASVGHLADLPDSLRKAVPNQYPLVRRVYH
jgi:hypothetical protein